MNCIWKKRLEMLQSNNPEKLKLLKMETTISIVEGYNPYEFCQQIKLKAFDILVPIQFPEVPPKGEFDVRKVKDSHYFFS